jgi:hypothetical protein
MVAIVVQHPRLLLAAQRLERRARTAEEKAERARHRKWLKETKSGRDRHRTIHKRRIAAETRISEAIWMTAEAQASKVASGGSPEYYAAFDEAYFSIMDVVVVAAETAAAKAIGFETWADFEAARESEPNAFF